MNKKLAHFSLLVLDALSLWAVYHLFDKWEGVSQSIATSEARIELQSPLGLYMATLIIPLIHTQCLVVLQNKSIEKSRNYAISVLFAALLVGGFIFDHSIKKEVIGAGYNYCPSESETLTYSQFKVYIKGSACQ